MLGSGVEAAGDDFGINSKQDRVGSSYRIQGAMGYPNPVLAINRSKKDRLLSSWIGCYLTPRVIVFPAKTPRRLPRRKISLFLLRSTLGPNPIDFPNSEGGGHRAAARIVDGDEVIVLWPKPDLGRITPCAMAYKWTRYEASAHCEKCPDHDSAFPWTLSGAPNPPDGG